MSGSVQQYNYCLFELHQFVSHSASHSFGLMLLGATSSVSMPLFFSFLNKLLASEFDASMVQIYSIVIEHAGSLGSLLSIPRHPSVFLLSHVLSLNVYRG